MPTTHRLQLVGPRGEPVQLWRTLRSHGLTELPPNQRDELRRKLTVAMVIPGAGPRRVTLAAGSDDAAGITVSGRALSRSQIQAVDALLRRMLCLDTDLSGLYRKIARDRDLRWATAGAGRMMRSPTVFEDVMKTICTTNCAWSGTQRMVGAIVGELGEDAGGGLRTFPTPERMADAPDAFYRDVARAGYRGAYLQEVARLVATGTIDLEGLLARPGAPSDDEVRETLLELPGVGPYAASHIMMLLGRYRPLILDSWTRPTYAARSGAAADDAAIEHRFARYGEFAGLAFWLYLTKDWVSDGDG